MELVKQLEKLPEKIRICLFSLETRFLKDYLEKHICNRDHSGSNFGDGQF